MTLVCFHLWVETIIWLIKRKTYFVSIDVNLINWRDGWDTLFQNSGLTALQKLLPVNESLKLNFLLIPVVVIDSWLKDKNLNVVKYRGPLQLPLTIKFPRHGIFELTLICQDWWFEFHYNNTFESWIQFSKYKRQFENKVLMIFSHAVE